MQIGLLPGDFDAFIKDLSGVTKGDFNFDIDGGAQPAEEGKPDGKGKGGGGAKKGGKKK